MNEKKQLSVLIDAQTLERARDHVYWSPGLTMSHLINLAIKDYLKELPLKPRDHQLKAGRKVKHESS